MKFTITIKAENIKVFELTIESAMVVILKAIDDFIRTVNHEHDQIRREQK